jgi:PadR family transcriptional regulator, regulatory protein AphA
MADSTTTTTRFAILGQLALRDWSAYELTRSMRRTLHWFWPRAESVIYAEAKRLVADGLATARQEPSGDGSRRKRSVYAITAKGRRALGQWLGGQPETYAMQLEPLLRVHLARFGTREDLLSSIGWTEQVAEQLLADADAVATEFSEGTHLFQDEAHIRGLLFDALSEQALALQRWAEHARKEVTTWPSIDGSDAAKKRAVTRMRRYLKTRSDAG